MKPSPSRHLAPSVRLDLAKPPRHALEVPPRRASLAAPDGPHIAGTPLPLSLSLPADGTLDTLPDGSTVRRLALGCSSCEWVSVQMCDVHLRDGERLFVHGEGGVGAQGAYEASGLPRLAGGTLATPPLPGALLVVELHTPARLVRVPLALMICGATAGTSPAFGPAAFAARYAMIAAAPPAALPPKALAAPARLVGDLAWTDSAEPPAAAGPTAESAASTAATASLVGPGAVVPPPLELPGVHVVLGETPSVSRSAARPPTTGRSLSASHSTASAPLAPAVGAGGACMVDVGCDPAWSDVSRGVVALLLDGGLCTGSLLNARPTPPDPTSGPLLLTGFHCVRHIVEQRVTAGWPDGAIGSFLPITVIYNWRSPGCAHPQAPEPWRGAGLQASYGASLVAYANDSDTALLRLAAPPPASFRARLNGWNAEAAPPRHVATIHHPSGDLQKLAVSWSAPALSLFCPGCCTPEGRRVVPAQRCWRHSEWLYDVGSSSHGSSGAPLFDSEGLVVGQMHGGYATCAHPRDDYFGTLAAAYNNSLRYVRAVAGRVPAVAAHFWTWV